MAARTTREVERVLEGDEVAQVLRESFYAPAVSARPASAAPPKARPEHYKVICISLYTEDLGRLDAAVQELKRRGYTRANRSAVLRAALQQLDLSRVPRGL